MIEYKIGVVEDLRELSEVVVIRQHWSNVEKAALLGVIRSFKTNTNRHWRDTAKTAELAALSA